MGVISKKPVDSKSIITDKNSKNTQMQLEKRDSTLPKNLSDTQTTTVKVDN